MGAQQVISSSDLRAQRILFFYLVVLYTGFVVFVSLYPIGSWRIITPNLLGFLYEPLDLTMLRYNRLDVLFNVVAYIPLGLLLALMMPLHNRWWACLIACVCTFSLSILMEALQNFLPSRTASTFDVICNGSGGLLGALLMCASKLRYVTANTLWAWRVRFLESGRLIDIGLILLLLWFFVQPVPEGGLFAVGDLGILFPTYQTSLLSPDYFIRAEAIVCALNMTALGLICSCLARTTWPRAFAVCVYLIALGVKTIGFSILFGWHEALLWVTPGAKLGLCCGMVIFFCLSFCNRRWRLILGMLSLLFGVMLVNYFSFNPYVDAAIRAWHPRNFAYLADIIRLASVFWPFLMFSYLLLYRRRRLL